MVGGSRCVYPTHALGWGPQWGIGEAQPVSAQACCDGVHCLRSNYLTWVPCKGMTQQYIGLTTGWLTRLGTSSARGDKQQPPPLFTPHPPLAPYAAVHPRVSGLLRSSVWVDTDSRASSSVWRACIFVLSSKSHMSTAESNTVRVCLATMIRLTKAQLHGCNPTCNEHCYETNAPEGF